MAREIALMLGYDRQRVYEALQLLAGWRLARNEAHVGWFLGDADPVTLARRLGGWADWHDQHVRHTRQRAQWRAWLDRHRPPTIATGQLLFEELEAALPAEESWIEEYASGISPPRQSTRHDMLQVTRHGTRGA
jgi:hypothetical protein